MLRRCCPGATPTAAFLVDHTEKAFYDLYRERKAHLRSIDEEVGPRTGLGGCGWQRALGVEQPWTGGVRERTEQGGMRAACFE